jgi:uroporphyrinogen-III decarboxylase
MHFTFNRNAFCAGHIANSLSSGFSDESRIIALPDGFTLEVEALGAAITTTGNGFTAPECLYTRPEMLASLPRIDEQEPAKALIERIRKARGPAVLAGKTILLKTTAPYSVLASLVEPKLFYRWLIKEKMAIKQALNTITAGIAAYITKAFASGASILSLADPFANPSVLGGSYQEFAASSLLELLRLLSPIKGVIHLCPYNSKALEKYGHLSAETSVFEKSETYIDVLRKYAETETMVLTGHQCIYTDQTRVVDILELF